MKTLKVLAVVNAIVWPMMLCSHHLARGIVVSMHSIKLLWIGCPAHLHTIYHLYVILGTICWQSKYVLQT